MAAVSAMQGQQHAPCGETWRTGSQGDACRCPCCPTRCAPEGWGACTALAVVVFAFFLAVARETRMGRLDRKWPFISVSALSRSPSRLQGGRAGGRAEVGPGSSDTEVGHQSRTECTVRKEKMLRGLPVWQPWAPRSDSHAFTQSPPLPSSPWHPPEPHKSIALAAPGGGVCDDLCAAHAGIELAEVLLQDDVAHIWRQVTHKQRSAVLTRRLRLAHTVGSPIQAEHLRGGVRQDGKAQRCGVRMGGLAGRLTRPSGPACDLLSQEAAGKQAGTLLVAQS
jgi:hypothetical protein